MSPGRPLNPVRTTVFGKDLARCKARGYDKNVLRVTMGRLIDRERLDQKQNDHPLRGSGSATGSAISAIAALLEAGSDWEMEAG